MAPKRKKKESDSSGDDSAFSENSDFESAPKKGGKKKSVTSAPADAAELKRSEELRKRAVSNKQLAPSSGKHFGKSLGFSGGGFMRFLSLFAHFNSSAEEMHREYRYPQETF